MRQTAPPQGWTDLPPRRQGLYLVRGATGRYAYDDEPPLGRSPRVGYVTRSRDGRLTMNWLGATSERASRLDLTAPPLRRAWWFGPIPPLDEH